ncbi:MAG: 4Fe-4S dicluster domain-containing protein [Nitrospiraceae bacterium]|nr:4Fe-4S dicluster domain-containing protein [Nitrospiraceae bacterium]MDA8338220.1 4Fe-4S dicluster domain-containing protein [Nitrospiraceae bacterium]
MKGEFILDRNHLSYWLRQMRKSRELIGPLMDGGKDIVFKSVDKIHELVLDCPASLPSPKEFLFPQYESMLRFTPLHLPLTKGGQGGVSLSEKAIEDLSDKTKRVIFGVRSCDISALSLMDKFYIEGHKDPYYARRRENTLFISIVCNNPDPTCFCIGLGTGPYLEKGFDIQMTDLGDRYFVQIGSPEGAKTVKAMSFLFRRPQKTDYEDQYEVFLSSKARFHKRINLEGIRQMILEEKVKDDFWQWVAGRCFECGGCVYDCPLCTCFTVTDRTYSEGIERVRLWDTCMFKGFTRMAGGVLPNEKMVKRTKRWYYHKLIYYPESLGGFGCVGCGRCTITCPGKIDMASIAARLKGLVLNEEEE